MYRMNKYGASAEKIEEVLKSNESDIEAITLDGKLYIRNKDWVNLRNVI